MITYDVAIVGSGPAGNAVTHTLLGHGLKVLWIEEGKPQPDYQPFSSSEIIGKYRNSGQKMILSRPPVPIGEPLAIGGGLDINAGIFQRPLKETYQGWNISTHPEWSWQKITQEFDKLESDLQVSLPASNHDTMTVLMKKGAANLGWNFKSVPVVNLSQRRLYVNTNIHKTLQEGGSFQSSTRLHSLHKQSGSWMLACEQQGRQVKFKAKKVFLAAGTLQTPNILFRSGLGPRVSSTFSYHPMVKVIAEFEQEMTTEKVAISSIQIKEFSPGITLGASVSSKSSILTELMKAGVVDPVILKKFNSQMMFYCTTSGSPKTYLYNLSSNAGPLAFSFQSQVSSELCLAIEKLVTFCFSMGAKRVYLGDSILTSAASAQKYLKAKTPPVTVVHLFSSMPMNQKKDSLINCEGCLRNTEGIYVVDASAMPGSPAVNPQELVMAMAQRIAKIALEKGAFCEN